MFLEKSIKKQYPYSTLFSPLVTNVRQVSDLENMAPLWNTVKTQQIICPSDGSGLLIWSGQERGSSLEKEIYLFTHKHTYTHTLIVFFVIYLCHLG